MWGREGGNEEGPRSPLQGVHSQFQCRTPQWPLPAGWSNCRKSLFQLLLLRSLQIKSSEIFPASLQLISAGQIQKQFSKLITGLHLNGFLGGKKKGHLPDTMMFLLNFKCLLQTVGDTERVQWHAGKHLSDNVVSSTGGLFLSPKSGKNLSPFKLIVTLPSLPSNFHLLSPDAVAVPAVPAVSGCLRYLGTLKLFLPCSSWSLWGIELSLWWCQQVDSPLCLVLLGPWQPGSRHREGPT